MRGNEFREGVGSLSASCIGSQHSETRERNRRFTLPCVPISSLVQQPPLGIGCQQSLITTDGVKPLNPVRGTTGFVCENPNSRPGRRLIFRLD